MKRQNVEARIARNKAAMAKLEEDIGRKMSRRVTLEEEQAALLAQLMKTDD